jgi:predicted transglutaminase-like cysteine proteinase
LLLAGCSEHTTLDTRLSPIETVNIEVNETRPYAFYKKKISEAVYLKPGQAGNCTDIARTKQVELAKLGISSNIGACLLRTGLGHAFLITEGGILDNRFDEVVRSPR